MEMQRRPRSNLKKNLDKAKAKTTFLCGLGSLISPASSSPSSLALVLLPAAVALVFAAPPSPPTAPRRRSSPHTSASRRLLPTTAALNALVSIPAAAASLSPTMMTILRRGLVASLIASPLARCFSSRFFVVVSF
jgi:hypothetical protein